MGPLTPPVPSRFGSIEIAKFLSQVLVSSHAPGVSPSGVSSALWHEKPCAQPKSTTEIPILQPDVPLNTRSAWKGESRAAKSRVSPPHKPSLSPPQVASQEDMSPGSLLRRAGRLSFGPPERHAAHEQQGLYPHEPSLFQDTSITYSCTRRDGNPRCPAHQDSCLPVHN